MSFEHGRNTTVSTPKGQLRGFRKDNVYHFYGIEYARAERFMKPVEVESWDGVKEATNYSYTCYPFVPDSFGNSLKSPHRYWINGENCQNLNLWTKHLDSEAKKPVFVWFHGGGFNNGSALDLYAFDGCNLCDYGDAVVVTINHRLNVFGYLDLRKYGEKYQYSVNAGNWDLIYALKWVQENIECFGGDKDNVTIFGQSGGGMKTITVMNMPASEGLYHRAMILSGVASGLTRDTIAAEAITDRMLSDLGIGVEGLSELTHRQLADSDINAFQELGGKGLPSIGPRKNFDMIGEPLTNGFTDYARKIPVIVGTNFSEFFAIPGQYHRYDMTDEEMTEAVETELGKETADKVIPAFMKRFPDKKILDILAYDASSFRKGTKEYIARRIDDDCADTYNYLFCPTIGINEGSTPQHNSDISYFFHNTDKVFSNDIGEYTAVLEEEMTDRLLQFGRTGNPNGKGHIYWPPCEKDKEETIMFDRDVRIEENLDNEFIQDMIDSGYYKIRF